MTKPLNLRQQVALNAREYGISANLFRNAIATKLGINLTDIECLGLLFHKCIATPTEISKHTGLSSGATTAMLDRLEKAKLIERKPNPDDRRGVLVEVLESSRVTVGPLFHTVRAAQNALVASYTDEELALLADFFKKSTDIWEAGRQKLSQ